MAADVGAVEPPTEPTATTVWCYGDSLTEGWSRNDATGGMAFYPYADWLPEASGGRLQGKCCGVSGELTREILRRLRRHLEEVGSDVRGHFVVLLGGTNDLARGYTAEHVLANLQDMATLVVDSGARPVFVTVPPLGARFGVADGARAAALRSVLNAGIRALTATEGGGGRTFLDAPVVELHDAVAVPRVEAVAVTGRQVEDEDARSAVYPVFSPPCDADGLHMTRAGYQLLARMVSDAVLHCIATARAAPA